jgi:protein pelota
VRACVFFIFLCRQALEAGAIKVLLITDNLFRSPVVADRRKYVGLVEAVKAAGGEVQVFSTQHSSGE